MSEKSKNYGAYRRSFIQLICILHFLVSCVDSYPHISRISNPLLPEFITGILLLAYPFIRAAIVYYWMELLLLKRMMEWKRFLLSLAYATLYAIIKFIFFLWHIASSDLIGPGDVMLELIIPFGCAVIYTLLILLCRLFYKIYKAMPLNKSAGEKESTKTSPASTSTIGDSSVTECSAVNSISYAASDNISDSSESDSCSPLRQKILAYGGAAICITIFLYAVEPDALLQKQHALETATANSPKPYSGDVMSHSTSDPLETEIKLSRAFIKPLTQTKVNLDYYTIYHTLRSSKSRGVNASFSIPNDWEIKPTNSSDGTNALNTFVSNGKAASESCTIYIFPKTKLGAEGNYVPLVKTLTNLIRVSTNVTDKGWFVTQHNVVGFWYKQSAIHEVAQEWKGFNETSYIYNNARNLIFLNCVFEDSFHPGIEHIFAEREMLAKQQFDVIADSIYMR